MKLSIITINYNNLAGLRKTVESVFAQTYRDFEYIIIDGASMDGSREYLNAVQTDHSQADNRLANLHIVSEPDTGIYNAMNKGIRIATSEYLLMLNSGDFLVDKYVVERILPELDGIDIVQGNTIEEHHDGEWRNRGYGRSELTFLDVQRGHFLHQASFCKRNLFEQYGYFDETYCYVSDTKFFIQCLGYGTATFKYIDLDIANFDMNGFSCTQNAEIRQKHDAESERLRREMFPGRLLAYCLESERKVNLYDRLRHYPCIWKMTMFALRLMNDKPSVVDCRKIETNA